MAPTAPSPAADVTRLPGPEPGDPAIAPTAGAITGYSPIVTTHGRGISESLDPTSLAVMSAKITSSQALTKNITRQQAA